MGEECKRRGNRSARSQIALEFMIVYSIVLVIFVVVFAVIATQRSVTLAQQQDVLMQLIAQNVAGYINQALQSGSGYSITAPLGAGIGYIPYNISVSTTGLVFANTTIGKQSIVGEASSGARNLVVNGTLVASGNSISLYVLPPYSGYLYISNYGGVIYIDQQVPQLPSLAENLSLFQQASLNAPRFTASANSVVAVASSPTLSVPKSITLDAWIYMNTIESYAGQVNVANPIVGEFASSSQPFLLAVTNYGQPSFVINDGSHMVQGSQALLANTWYNIAATYNSSASQATIYINGNAVATGSFSVGSFAAASSLTIGGAPNNGTYFNGYISDVQVYNASLSPGQIASLYSGGPSAAPTSLVSNIVGWWPLNGNFNDYSGHGNTGTPYDAPLSPVIALVAKVTSFGGAPLAGVPLGFWSANGLLGGYNSIVTSTGSNGMQGTLLISNGFSVKSQTESIYFNGNLSAAYKLLGWWPLDIGNSNTIYDYSGKSVGGTFSHGSYGYLPNESATLTAKLNGQSSYITSTPPRNLIPNQFTISAWAYLSGSAHNAGSGPAGAEQELVESGVAASQDGGAILALDGNALAAEGLIYNGSWTQVTSPSSTITKQQWYLETLTYNGSQLGIWVNGVLLANTPVSKPIGTLTSNNIYFGARYGTGSNIGAYFNGSLQNIQIYNTSLSAAQIGQAYSEGIAGTPAPNQGLVGWWPMSGSSTNYARLQSPYPTNSVGASYNSVTYSSLYGLQSSTLFPLFNGANSVVTLQGGAFPANALCSVTATAWVYDTGMPSSLMGGVFNFSGTGYFASIQLNNTAVRYGMYTGSAGKTWSANTAYSLKDTWNFVAISRNSGGAGTGYINSLPVGTATGLSCLTATTGKFGYVGTGYFNGSIVDVQIYNASLNIGQIEQLYQQGFPTPTVINASIG